MTSKSAAELLDELIGPEGRLAIAYRQAAASGAAAGDQAWGPVHRILAEAVGVSSGMVAGRPEAPYSSQLGVLEPCGGCGQPTLMRVHSDPWHPSCWQRAGCPIAPAAAAPAGQATADESPAPEGPTEGAESATEASGVDDGASPLDGAAEGPYRRRKAQRQVAEDDEDTAGADEADKERRAFSKALRQLDGWDEATDGDCGAALEAWHRHVQAMGRPFTFAATAGYTGVMLYELLAAGHGSMVQPEPLASELAWQVHDGRDAGGTVRTFSFTDPEAAAQAGEALTEIDVKSQYLASARSVYVGDGEPDLHDDPEALREHLGTLIDRPGWVQLAAAPDLSTAPPHAARALAAVAEGTWLPLPLAKYLRKDCGIDLEPTRALLWPKERRGQRLRVWATTVNEARVSLERARDDGQPGATGALAVLKSVYATFLGGMLGSERNNDRGTLRPDWRDEVIAQASVNAWRALDKARRTGLGDGVRILGGLKDAVWLVSPAGTAPVRPAGLQWADQPDTAPDTYLQAGKWRVETTAEVTDGIAGAAAEGRAGLVARRVRESAAQQ